jgi:hypothetical protein
MIKIKRSKLKELSLKHFNSDSLESQNKIAMMISTAQCARVSYTVVGEEGKFDFESNINLHNRLIDSGHMSPAEHCAQVMCETDYYERPWSRNFKGFMQYRELVEDVEIILR